MAKLPPDPENSENHPSTEKDFFAKTLDFLGLQGENDPKNLIGIRKNRNENGQHIEVIEYVPFFQHDPKGWKAPIVDIHRNQYTARAEGNKAVNPQWEVRLEKPIIKEDGTPIKYTRPRKVGTQPSFFEPILVAVERGENIHTLIITEGTKKASMGCRHGAYVIAVPGIHNLKEKNTGKIHGDIIELIKKCGVKRVIFLLDGDAADISAKALEKGDDLTTRPKSFFSAVNTFRNLLIDEDLDLWVLVVDSGRMAADTGKSREELKGLDDILFSLPEKRKEIIADLNNVQPSPFFLKFDVTHSTTKVFQHLGLHDVNSFILQRQETFPELLTSEFKFNGGIYRWDAAVEKCTEVAPAAAEMFIRIGDDYFKLVQKPDKNGKLEKTLVRINKQTIIDDHGKKILKHIRKFELPCVVPDHANFQQVVANCWNLYHPLTHVPVEEKCELTDFPKIHAFLKHISAGRMASYAKKENNQKIQVSVLDMLFDYFQILYRNPQQKLPIICLISEENNTGKSTFAFLLRLIFGANVAIVGNSDLASDFNSHIISKLIIIIDETFIDKRIIFEKVKSWVTALKGYMNAKGRDQVEIDMFMKVVLITNNEENFIPATKNDIRFWVLKVSELQEVEVDILQKMEEEIPAFLSFLSRRKLATERKNRMHFDPDLLRTEALTRVIEHSQPGVEKDIRHYLREMFLDTGLQTIEMSQKAIHQEALGGKQNANYVEKILKKNMGLLPYHVWVFASQEYPTREEALFFAKEKNPGLIDAEILSLVQQKFKTKRYSYPKNIVDYSTGSATMKRIQVDDVGRPYIFQRADFVSEKDEVDPSPENKFLAEIFEGNNSTPTYKADEVPFPILRH